MPTSVLSLFPHCFSYQWVVLGVPVPVLFVAGWVVLEPRSPRKTLLARDLTFSCFIRLMNSFLQAARQLTRWEILPLCSIFDWDSTIRTRHGNLLLFHRPATAPRREPLPGMWYRYPLLHWPVGIILTSLLYNSYNCGGMRNSLLFSFFCPSTF